MITEIYAGSRAVEIKSDSSPVTEADRRAEAEILPTLRAFDLPKVFDPAATGAR